jgi:hypothetical protein
MTTSESKHLISIEDFANIGPINRTYSQVYKVKLCTYCDSVATKKALFDLDGIILEQRFCARHIRGIKK